MRLRMSREKSFRGPRLGKLAKSLPSHRSASHCRCTPNPWHGLGCRPRLSAVFAQGFVERHVSASTVTSAHSRDAKHISVPKQSHVVLVGTLAAFTHIQRRDDVADILVLDAVFGLESHQAGGTVGIRGIAPFNDCTVQLRSVSEFDMPRSMRGNPIVGATGTHGMRQPFEDDVWTVLLRKVLTLKPPDRSGVERDRGYVGTGCVFKPRSEILGHPMAVGIGVKRKVGEKARIASSF